jgi:hypothetical protein
VNPKSFAAFLGKSGLSRLNLLSCCNSATNISARAARAIDKKVTATTPYRTNKQNHESKKPRARRRGACSEISGARGLRAA